MADETLVEALADAIHDEWPAMDRETVTEMAQDVSDCRRWALPILVAHATPEARAALLRTLLGERLEEMAFVKWSRIIEHPYESNPTINEEALLNFLAPEVTP